MSRASLRASVAIATALASLLPAAQASATETRSARRSDVVFDRNWTGYVADSSVPEFLSVEANIWVPTLTCQPGETSYVEAWTGVGGDEEVGGVKEALPQTGLNLGCDNGRPFYDVDYEVFVPNRRVVNFKTLHPRPGDLVSFDVYRIPNGGTHWGIFAIWYPGGKGDGILERAPDSYMAKRTGTEMYRTAECIVENQPGSPVTQFTPIKFSYCAASVVDGPLYDIAPGDEIIPNATVQTFMAKDKAGNLLVVLRPAKNQDDGFRAKYVPPS